MANKQSGSGGARAQARELIEASRDTTGTKSGFVGGLFLGQFRPAAVFPFPRQEEEDREHGTRFLERLDRFLSENLDGDEVDRTGEIPARVLEGLANLGAFGMKIPVEYGGLGFSNANYGRAMACVSRHCASTAATLSAHQSIGVPEPLLLFGTEEQKRKYLPRIARGAISAFALTEPEVGSDPARMRTTATRSPDGQYYILNGEKLWCTNGVVAEVLVVMARMAPRPGDSGKVRISAFIVERGMPGFEVLERCRFMGLNGIQNGHLRFRDVRVPRENLLWEEGRGLHLALATLDAGRLSLPWIMIGASREGLRMASHWARTREQWGCPIGEHEAIAAKLARMRADVFAMEAVTGLVTSWLDRKAFDVRLESAMAKLFCSERSYRIADDVVQIRGGRGYERAESLARRGEKPLPVERMYRDARINLIVEGTSEILRLYIAREGLDAHVRRTSAIFDNRIPLLKRAGIAARAAGFYLGWYPAQWLPGEALADFRRLGPLAEHLRFVVTQSRRLARTAFHLMLRHGPALERRQLQLMRLVDIATNLFAMSAVISRARSEGRETLPLADLFCHRARDEIRELFFAIRQNHDSLIRAVSKAETRLSAPEVFRKAA